MLDNLQLDAVYSDEKNILVVASPGSGKTTVIINKIGYLISEKMIDPKNIAVITFTRAAAENMKIRFERLLPGRKPPFFGTFHSLFYNILSRQLGSVNIICGRNAFNVVEKTLKRYMGEVSEDRVKDVLSCISGYKTGFKKWEQFEEIINLNVLAQCYKDYEDYKSSKNLLDFDDLQLRTLELFKGDKHILEFYRQKLKYVLVDEFQDCDEMQLELLRLICKGNSIFAVGDEDQCIYGFRGARPDYMVSFHENFDGAVKKFLVNNYRSVKNIVDMAGKLIENNKLRNIKEFSAASEEKGLISCERYFDERGQSDGIADMVESKVKEGIGRFKDFAVLYRTNIEARSLIDSFVRRNIPFIITDKSYNFYDHFICADILSYIKLSKNMSDRTSFLKVVNRPFRYIGKVNLDKLRNHPFREDCIDILCNIPTLPFFQYKELHELRKKVLYINKLEVISAVDYILFQLGYNEFIKEYCKKSNIPEEDIYDIIEELKESMSGFSSIDEFQKHVESVREQIKNQDMSEADAVLFSTIHGVKGMEFKEVFIINCVDGTIPFHREGKSSEIEEERRLFYVGITRAKESIYLGLPLYIKGKASKESPFLRECGIDKIIDCSDDYKAGSLVQHNNFGKGEVVRVNNGEIEIKFANGVVRCFNMEVLIGHKLLKKMA